MEEYPKRRSSELEEQGVAPRPPPKKRFLSASSPSESESEDEEGSSDAYREPLEKFQRDAIYRQWKDYTRTAMGLKKQLSPLERLKKEMDASTPAWHDLHTKLDSNVNKILNEKFNLPSNQSTSEPTFDSVLEEEKFTALIPNLSNATQHRDFGSINKLDKALEYYSSQREKKLSDFGSLLDPSLKNDYEISLNNWKKGHISMMDLKHKYQTSLLKFLSLAEELNILDRRIESTERLTKDMTLAMEKRARARSTATTTGRRDTVPSSSSPLSSSPLSSSLSNQQPPLASDIAAEGSIQALLDNQELAENQLIRVQQTLDQRLREIESLKNDRISLKQQIARLEMDWISQPEPRIYKAPMCRSLYNARNNVKQKCSDLYKQCHDLEGAYDALLEKRRYLNKPRNDEKTERIRSLDENLRRLDAEVTRVRSERDHFQMSIEENKAIFTPYDHVAELKVIADTRNELAHYLETELLRLQRKMAAKTGDKLYYDLYLKANPQQSVITILENEIRKIKEKVDQTRDRLLATPTTPTTPTTSATTSTTTTTTASSSNNNSNTNNPQLIEQQLEAISQWIRLEKEAASFEEKYGFHPSVSDEQSAIQILQDRMEKEKQLISQEKHKVEALEPVTQQYLEEIGQVIRLYPNMEEQCIRQVEGMAASEEEIRHSKLERFKTVQTFQTLHKTKDSYELVSNALTKQIEKQLTHIKDIDARERNLMSQATCLDRTLNTSNAVYQIYKQKSEEAKATLKELEERSQLAKNKIAELQESIKEKIELVEEGAHKRLRVEESGELLKRKLESTNRTENPAETELVLLKKDYLRLLTCTICEQRLKSHAITKCMHTYCKRCLDDLVKYDNMVCPNCSLAFEPNEVAPFY